MLAAGTINDQSRDILHFNRQFAQFILNFFLVNEITKLKFATVGNTAASYWKNLCSKLSPDTVNIDFVLGFIQSFQTNSVVASLTLSLARPSQNAEANSENFEAFNYGDVIRVRY